MFAMIRVGINGFGRIGRSFMRAIRSYPDIQVVAINDPASGENLAHLLKYDTTHRRFPEELFFEDGFLWIGQHQKIRVSHHTDPKRIDWQDLELDFLLESSGRFKNRAALEPHLSLASKVILSAPPEDDIPTIVMGINEPSQGSAERIYSNASCTTNNAAPLLKVVEDLAGIEHAFITTVHSYTTDQQIQDGPHKDFRRGRSAAESIVPTSTGAAKALTRVFPHLEGRIGGAGIRVPVPDGSLTDITFTLKKTITIKEVNQAFLEASQGNLKKYLAYTKDPIVSRDIIGSPYSCTYDEELTTVLGPMLKVVGWYDNEMGYAHRLADLMQHLSQ